MPIYEYLCSACEHEFETLQGFSEDPLLFCPECGEEALNKKISAAAFHLKGTGWYETDFKDNKKEDAATNDGDKDSADKDKTAAKSSDDDKKDAKKKDASAGDGKSSGTGDSASKSKSKSKSADKKSSSGSKTKSSSSRQSAA